MQLTVIVVGTVAEMVGWWFVAFRGRDVWRLMPVVLGAMSVLASLGSHILWTGAMLALPPGAGRKAVNG